MKTKNEKILMLLLAVLMQLFAAAEIFAFDPPASNRKVMSLNYDWKFIKSDVASAQTAAFNDASWSNVSLPHTYNNTDLFDTWVSGSGNYGFAGMTWYRKHFILDTLYAGRKVFVEFEGIRQAGEFYINGVFVGRHENGVGPCGIDISAYVNFGSKENVLAVKIDNSLGYKEVASATSFQWNTSPFHPNYGGIVNNVNLHIMDPVYQTLPLYSNLGTSGTYVYADAISVVGKSATINVELEVRNSTAASKSVDYDVIIVDRNGNQVAIKTVTANAFAASETKKLSTSLPLANISFWSPDYPYLYKVFTVLKVGGVAVDAYETTLGVREVKFSVAEGLTVNGSMLYLKGYAPRSTMEWVSVGMAPTWLEEFDLNLMKESNANFIRPMHVAPKSIDVRGADKLGIFYAVPAGDAEGDATGRQWEHRVELMRDMVIYFRNNPSVLFFEGGNQNLTPAHMQQMVDVRKTWDPKGGRFTGTRSTDNALAGIQEYGSTMDIPGTSSVIPIWDAEFAREECPRRVWDKYSPPSFGYVNIADTANQITEYPVNSFKFNSSEDLARSNVKKYVDRWAKRGGQGLSAVMAGGAKIIFADGVSHGRMIKTELARVSGSTDAARLPKESYYAMRVAQSSKSDIHIIGHWTYPAATVKSVYVMANTETVSLATYDNNGTLIKNYGTVTTPSNVFEFAFPNVSWNAGKIVAIGYKDGVQVVTDTIYSAGAATALRVTPVVGPGGFIADGSDIAMFDVEVVDAKGIRVPTQESAVSLAPSGQGVYLGGYNSGIQNSIFKSTLNVECGINRVFVRATRNSGAFTLTATATGLQSGSATINALPFLVTNGLTEQKPQSLIVVLKKPIVDDFSFVDQIDVALNTVITSAPVTLMGMDTAQVITISSLSTAKYSINGGAFVSSPGTVNNGDQVRVQILSDAKYSTMQFATVNIGGVSDAFSVTTFAAPKVVRNLAYMKKISATAEEVGNVATKANDGISNTRWSAGTVKWPQSIVVDLDSVFKVDSAQVLPYSNRDYRYVIYGSLDNVTFFPICDQSNNTSGGAIISNKFAGMSVRYVKLTVTGAATYTGGFVSLNEFRLYQAPFDTKPDQFNIIDTTGVEVFQEAISTAFKVTGIDGPADISFTFADEVAEYSINGAPFVSTIGVVHNNDVIRVKLSTGSQYSNTHTATLSIGGVSENYVVTTMDVTTETRPALVAGKMLLYPNPSKGLVHVEGMEVGGKIEVFSSTGSLIMSAVLTESKFVIDLDALSDGMYTVKYSYINETAHANIVLQR